MSTQINENVHEAYFVLTLLAFCALDVLNLGLNVVFFLCLSFYFPMSASQSLWCTDIFPTQKIRQKGKITVETNQDKFWDTQRQMKEIQETSESSGNAEVGIKSEPIEFI